MPRFVVDTISRTISRAIARVSSGRFGICCDAGVNQKNRWVLELTVFQPIGLFQIDHCDPRLSVCHPNR
jgi:hypothetical protein